MKKIKCCHVLKSFILFLFFSLVFISIKAQDLNPVLWPHLKGYWKFQNASKLTKATVGKDLLLVGNHQYIAGPAVGDTAIRIGIGSYYQCTHNMTPNGGGDSVNQYTLLFDFKVLSFKKWHTFFKTDSANNNDGECFIRPITGSNPGRLGVGATGYSVDSINPNQWYRLMISVNLNHFYRYYINGKLFHEGDTQVVDGRFALTPKMIFFGDDNQEDDTIDIASVAVFDTCLSANDIAKIGSINPCIANPPKISLGRDTSLCDYNSIIKNAGAGFKKYQWSTGSLQQSVTLTKSIGLGKKNVWCKVTDLNGCVVSDTFILTYLVSPVVSLGADQAFCQGYTTNLVAGSDTSFNYLWSFLPNGYTLSNKSSIKTDSGGKYTVNVSTKQGCVGKDTVQILVYKRPAKPTVSVTGSLNVCQGGSVFLSGPNGFFDYQWNNGANTQSISINKNDTLKLKVTDNNNCVSLYSDSLVVKVFLLPPKPSLTLTGSALFCDGDSVQLTVTKGYAYYIWQDGPGDYLRSIKQAALYYVYVRDKNNCKSINSDSILLSVNPRPKKPTVLISGKMDICEGEKTILIAPSGYSKYKWSNNQFTQNDTISKKGQYRVSVENNFGCKSVFSDSIGVNVHAILSRPLIIQIGKDSLRISQIANQYRWFRNNVILSDTLRGIFMAPSGFYQAQIKDNWCWSELSDSFFYRNSGVAKLDFNTSKLLIYPNPTEGDVIIKLNGLINTEDVRIEIADMKGQIVYATKLTSLEIMAGVTRITLKHYSSGIYQVKIIKSDSVWIGKIEKY